MNSILVNAHNVVANDNFKTCFICILCLIALDIITGLIQALKNRNFKSSRMREGLYNKCKILVTILFGVIMDSFGGSIIAFPISVPIMCYIGLMEISSIVENNNLLLPDNVKKALGMKGENDDETDQELHG